MTSRANADAIETRLVLEAIYAVYGYDLRGYASSTMQRRLQAVLAKTGLRHLGELSHRVVRDAGFFAEIVDDLTVRVSQMFRDPAFYRAFRQHVIPVLRTYPLLRLWHSGCAAGQEVYGTAIALCEAGLYERAQIYATDISPAALAQATQGTYSSDQVATYADNYARGGGTRELSRYYTEAYGGIAMADGLRRNVLFFQHDLVGDHIFGEMDVIFCRNVLIYFARPLRQRVLRKLALSLRPGGYLCLGSSERLSDAELHDHFREVASGHRIYRYEGGVRP